MGAPARDTGTFLQYPTLITLPALLRVQRRLETKCYASTEHGDPKAWEGQAYKDLEKESRDEIHQALLEAGIKAREEFVTCNGFQITQRGQKGREALNETKAIEQLVALGVDREAVVNVFKGCTEEGEPCAWAEVKPVKGARVRKERMSRR